MIDNITRYLFGIAIGMLIGCYFITPQIGGQYDTNAPVRFVTECQFVLDGNGTTIALGKNSQYGIYVGGMEKKDSCFTVLSHFIIDGRAATETTGINISRNTYTRW